MGGLLSKLTAHWCSWFVASPHHGIYTLNQGVTPPRVPKPLLEAWMNVKLREREAGFTVVCPVCDMVTPNQELLKKKLGVHASKPQFEVDGKDVICLYDVSHLMKYIRNMLLKQDVTLDGKFQPVFPITCNLLHL